MNPLQPAGAPTAKLPGIALGILLAAFLTTPAPAQDAIEFRSVDGVGNEQTRLSISSGATAEVKLSATFNANSNRITNLGAPTAADDAARLADIVRFAPASAQADASANPSMWINDTGGGSLLQLQVGGVDRFVVSNAGMITSGAWNGGTIGVAYGGTGTTSFAAGSMVFSNGTSLTEDNANLIWDDASNRLGIGVGAPTARLHIGGTAGVDGIRFPDGTLQTTASGAVGGGWTDGGTAVYLSTGTDRVGIGTSAPEQALHVSVAGDAGIALRAVAVAGMGPVASSGPNSPTTVVDDASFGQATWSNPGNAMASDDAGAGAALSGYWVGNVETSHYLKATGFGFNLPAGSVVDGIIVHVEGGWSGSMYGGVIDNQVRIVKGGVVGSVNRAIYVVWNANDQVYSFGGSTDLWGETWTPSDINAGNFGVAFAANYYGGTYDNATARVDHIRITVYYKPPTDVDWSIGADHSDSGNFKISAGTGLSYNTLTIRSTGAVGVGRLATANAFEVEGNASKTTAGDWLANSDRRLKTDIQELQDGLSIIRRLRPVRFRYTDEYRAAHPSVEDRFYCNFIAQEFREVFPECVRDDGTGRLQIDTYNVRPYLVAAVQELDAQNATLASENAALRQRIDALEARVGPSPPLPGSP